MDDGDRVGGVYFVTNQLPWRVVAGTVLAMVVGNVAGIDSFAGTVAGLEAVAGKVAGKLVGIVAGQVAGLDSVAGSVPLPRLYPPDLKRLEYFLS